MTSLEALAARWKSEADVVEQRYADKASARLLRTVAAELVEVLREEADELLTLAEAAEVSGYASDTLRHHLADGSLPNAGVSGKPRIRRGDLPTKPGANMNADEDEAKRAALSILTRGSS